MICSNGQVLQSQLDTKREVSSINISINDTNIHGSSVSRNEQVLQGKFDTERKASSVKFLSVTQTYHTYPVALFLVPTTTLPATALYTSLFCRLSLRRSRPPQTPHSPTQVFVVVYMCYVFWALINPLVCWFPHPPFSRAVKMTRGQNSQTDLLLATPLMNFVVMLLSSSPVRLMLQTFGLSLPSNL